MEEKVIEAERAMNESERERRDAGRVGSRKGPQEEVGKGIRDGALLASDDPEMETQPGIDAETSLPADEERGGVRGGVVGHGALSDVGGGVAIGGSERGDEREEGHLRSLQECQVSCGWEDVV